MDVITGHESALLSSPVLALGNFDGVHVGHQRLLQMAVEVAGPDGCPAVLTFEPHPAAILAPGHEPPLLTTLPRKLELLEHHGARATIVEPFTLALAAVPPEEFVDEVLVASLGVKAVVVGYDFTYGEKRRGSVETLRLAGRRQGFGVHVVPAVTLDGLAVSSTNVRALLRAGDTAEARILLGRPHDIDGEVVRGAGRGRDMGIPTANIAPAGGLLPRSGVYAGALTTLDDTRIYPGALSLGSNATFTPDGPLSLEIHLFDFDGDLYDRPVRVHFHDWIREEARFDSVDELLVQIRQDLALARRMMGVT